jgi:hypothetical protein
MSVDLETLYSELGVLGNTHQNLTIQYVKTELVDKAEQGDTTALFNLENVARHSEVEEVATYARQQFQRITGTTFGDAQASEDDDED